jgi:CRISPR-associated protein Cas1
MGRPHCDPIDLDATLARLAAGAHRPAVYRAYAETAARPYSRASWEALLRTGKRTLAQDDGNRQRANVGDAEAVPDAVADAESDAFWEGRLKIKPSVITTEADSATISTQGGSLHVRDGQRRFRYDPGSRMPSAVVMAGWGGVVTIEAMRFCASHGIAIIILDWMRELMTVMPARPSDNAALLRAQAYADPLAIAVRIVQAKIAAAAKAGAMTMSDAVRFIEAASRARSVQEAMIIEAQAARLAWPNPPIFRWRVGSPRIPTQWKHPPPARSRTLREVRSKRHATHPLNALLNAVFSVTSGRIVTALAERGAHPAIGYLHADRRGRFSLAFDTIEPLRPYIEKSVFAFVHKHQFSATDFIRIKDGPGSIRLGSNLLRAAIAECAPSRAVIDDAARAMMALILGSRLTSSQPLAHPVEIGARHSIADTLAGDGDELIGRRIGGAAPGRRLQRRFNLGPEGGDRDR